MTAAGVRAARREIESELDVLGWPWDRARSLLLDALLGLEERQL